MEFTYFLLFNLKPFSVEFGESDPIYFDLWKCGESKDHFLRLAIEAISLPKVLIFS